MEDRIQSRLAALGLKLPSAPPPAANYSPYIIVGEIVYVAGQLPIESGTLIEGKIGEEADVEQGVRAAAACALNLLAQIKAACGGNIERLARPVKLTGFVNATPDFRDHPTVLNGASDLIVKVLGDSGKHARSAVGVASLPFNATVEIEAIFQIS
ncbi:MAG: RidA family protein [Albidovulum sp.]|nr:RidA family protein [Albidovulum sp.]MDE0532264.1 RidA family protein [Albidovulum sp.]